MCSSVHHETSSSAGGGTYVPASTNGALRTGQNQTSNSSTSSKVQNVISLKRRTIYVMYFMAFVDLLAVSLFLPLLSSGIRNLGATPFMTGLIGSTYGAIQIVSSPAMGWGSDKYGQKAVLVFSLLTSAVAYTVQGLSFNILMMLAARVLAGICKHTLTIGKSIVSELSSKDKSYIIGNFNAFASMGFILGPTLGAHIAQMENGFQLVCYLSSAAFVANAILLIFLVPEPSKLTTLSPKISRKFKQTENSKSENNEGSSLTGLKSAFQNADIHSVLLLAVRFLFSFATLVFRENLTIVLQEKYNSNLVNSGYLTSCQALMTTLLGFAVGPVNAFIYRGNSFYMVLISGILKTAVLLTLFWSTSYWLAASMLLAVSCLNPFLRVGITTLSLEGHHDDIGTLLGLSQSATSLARMISPTAAGMAVGMSSDGPFLLAAVSSVGGVIVALIAQFFTRKRATTAHAKTD